MLQRSVTDNRRLRSGRPKVSMSIDGPIIVTRPRLAGEARADGHANPLAGIEDRQPRAAARQERTRRNLSVEPRAPASGNRRVARRAMALGCESVVLNQ